MANDMNYNTGNKAAVAKIKPEISSNGTIFVDEGNMAKMIPPSSFSNEAREALANTYNAFKLGK
jgi:putrescine transport system substrate-binding protein